MSRPAGVADPAGGSPATTASCSTMASVKALLSVWPARRLVTKNDTTVTPAGGWSTNQAARADLPAQGGPWSQR